MENYQELQKAISNKQKIEDYLERIKSIGLTGQYSRDQIIAIKNNDNGRYDFDGVAKIIGKEKLDSIVSQFQGLVLVELLKANEHAHKEVNMFTIIKQPE